MQQYTRDWYKSRNIDIWEQPLPCEVCLYNLIQWKKDWVKVMNDIHHIESSNRGKRKHNKDGSDIVWLCCQHHSLYHWDNGWQNRQELLEIVQEMISVYSRMWCKEKLWELVRILYEKQK